MSNAIDYTISVVTAVLNVFDMGVNGFFGMSLHMMGDLSALLNASAIWVIIAILILANNVEKFAFFKKAEKILWIIAVGLMAIQLLSGSVDFLRAFFNSVGSLFDGSIFKDISVSLYVLPQGFLGAITEMVYAIAWLLIICEFSYPFTSKSISGIISETFGKKKSSNIRVIGKYRRERSCRGERRKRRIVITTDGGFEIQVNIWDGAFCTVP